MRLSTVWSLTLRMSVGGFWLYFSSQRWFDRTWVKELLETAAAGNYLPLYGDLLRQTAASWETATIVVTIAETIIGLMIILGLFPRAAASVGAFISLNLWLSFSFCDCWWNKQDAPQVFWFYFSALLLNLAIVREKHHSPTIKMKRQA